jgi:thymidylate synthase
VAVKIRNGRLDIHVFNRSNDAIWGGPAGGANFPQFTVLQEYLAGRIGCHIGLYHHTTDSMHVYTDNPQWEKLKDLTTSDCYYEAHNISPTPMFAPIEEPKYFDHDLEDFFNVKDNSEYEPHYKTYFFEHVVKPMWKTFQAYKAKETSFPQTTEILADDWRKYTSWWLNTK